MRTVVTTTGSNVGPGGPGTAIARQSADDWDVAPDGLLLVHDIVSGGYEGGVKTYDLDNNPWVKLSWSFEHYGIPDRFTIRRDGAVLLDSGFVSGGASGWLNLEPGGSGTVDVIVSTSDEGTGWDYTVTLVGLDATVPEPPAPWIIEPVIGRFSADLNGLASYQGDVSIGRRDGTLGLLAALGGSFVYGEDRAWVSDASYVLNSQTLFRGDLELNLRNGLVNVTRGGEGALSTGAVTVDLTGMQIRANEVLLDGRIVLPKAALGMEIDTAEYGTPIFMTPDGLQLNGNLGGYKVQGRLLDLLTITAEDIDVVLKDDDWKIQMKATLAGAAFGQGDDKGLTFDLTDDNHLTIKNDGTVELVGELELKTAQLKLVGGWSLSGVKLAIDTTDRLMTGTATIGTPFGMRLGGSGLDVQPTLSFLYDPFELNGIGLALDNLSVPFPTMPLLLLKSIGGSVDNVASAISKPVTAKFKAEVELGRGIAGSQLAKAELEFDVTSTSLVGTFEAEFMKLDLSSWGRLAPSSISLMEYEGEFDLNRGNGTFKQTGEASVLDGLLKAEMTLTFDKDFNFGTSGAGAVTLPDFIPLLGGKTLAKAEYQIVHTNDGNSANDYVAAWGQIDIRGWQAVVGVRVGFDGSLTRIGAETIPLEHGVTVDGKDDKLVLTASWENAASDAQPLMAAQRASAAPAAQPSLVLHRPDGTQIAEADFKDHGYHIVEALSGPNSRSVLLTAPEEGRWSLSLAGGAGLGEVSLSALRPDRQAAGLRLDGPITLADGRVSLAYSHLLAGDSGTLSFWLDDDLSTLDGIYMGSQTVYNHWEGWQAGSFDWRAAGIAPGDYQVYAVLTEGGRAPQTFAFEDVLTFAGATDLAVTVTADTASITPWGAVTLTLAVTNLDADHTAQNVALLTRWSELPTWAVDGGWDHHWQYDHNGYGFALGDIAAQETVTRSMVVYLTDIGRLGESAVVDVLAVSDSHDRDMRNNTAAWEGRVERPDTAALPPGTVTVASTLGDQTSVVPGEVIDYALTVTNTGTTRLGRLRVTEMLGDLVLSKDQVREIHGLDPGQSVTLPLQAHVIKAGTLKAVTAVNGAGVAETLLHSTLEVRSAGIAPADLSLAMQDLGVDDYGRKTVTVALSNDGPGIATDVAVRLVLPAGWTIVSSAQVQGHPTRQPVCGRWATCATV